MRTTIDRRQFLRPGALAGGAAAVPALRPAAAPSFVGDRPLLTHGIRSGDVTSRSGIVGTRADGPAT